MITIRSATTEDAGALAAIYAYYVEKTAISFEYVAPTPAEFSARIEKTLRKYPYLVAEENGVILGYAYAGPFKERAAYDRCCELTIYLAREERGRGVGTRLYTALEEELQKRGFCNLYACIAVTDRDDPFLDDGSPRFHAKCGYTEVGRFRRCGVKFDRYYDMIWMEKLL